MDREIITVDCKYLFDKFAASYILKGKNCVAIIETGTNSSVKYILDALRENSISPLDVKYIMVTHIHLDHAGGASLLMKECINAKFVVHPRGKRHMISPERLINGAKAVYGDEEFQRLYGEIFPIDENRVLSVDDGEILECADKKFQFIYTPGHAKHHMVIHELNDNIIFTGDSFGLAYPFLRTDKELFIFPSSSPSDFSPKEAINSIKKVVATDANMAYLTHYGKLINLKKYGERLIEILNCYQEIVDDILNDENLIKNSAEIEKNVAKRIEKNFILSLKKIGMDFNQSVYNFLETDFKLNVAGVIFYIKQILQEKNK